MAWICENCSTANENKDRICFVCETPRSKASLMAEKAEERRKHEEAVLRILNKNINKVVKISGIVVRLAESLGIILVLALLIMRIKDGYVSDIVPSLVSILSFIILKAGLIWKNVCSIAVTIFTGFVLKVHVSHLGFVFAEKMKIVIANTDVIIRRIIETVGTAIQRGIRGIKR